MPRSRSRLGGLAATLTAATLLAVSSAVPAAAHDSPPPPGLRMICCMLSKHWPFTTFPEPTRATFQHTYGAGGYSGLFTNEISGILYTTAGGFIDLGHLRSVGDLTWYYYQALAAQSHQGEVIKPPEGTEASQVTLLRDVPEDRRLDVARSIAYSESVFHEIKSYWSAWFGRTSAFSPEDLVSNFLGTWLAARAIQDKADGVDYNAAFTNQLEAEMHELGVVDHDTSVRAFDLIDGTWVKGIPLDPSFLRRRNFAVKPVRPWLVDDVPGANEAGRFPTNATPGFAIPADAAGYYTATFPLPPAAREADPRHAEKVDTGRFDELIQAVRIHADQRFGPDYDQPGPVGRVAGKPEG